MVKIHYIKHHHNYHANELDKSVQYDFCINEDKGCRCQLHAYHMANDFVVVRVEGLKTYVNVILNQDHP